MDDKVYLGDGVYAEFDGMHIVLSTERIHSIGDNKIYLHQNVLKALDYYRESLKSTDG